MSTRQHGVVVTHVYNLDQLTDCLTRGGYDTIKVVTGWGMDAGWNAENMRQVLRMAPNVIVRTVAGDPSYDHHNPDFQLPDANRVRNELAPWYAIRPDIMFEIGNEPNIDDHPSDAFIYSYCAVLKMAIDVCRHEFPQARLISPGLCISATKDFERFNQIASDAFRRCDMIGLHCYADYGFAKGQLSATNQLRDALRVAQRLYGDMPWYVTEYGINNCDKTSTAEKGRRYAGMAYCGESDPLLPANVVGLTYYHLNMKHDYDTQYHIFPDGDSAYGSRLRAAAPRENALAVGAAALPLQYVIIDSCSANPADNFASVRQAPNLDAQEAGRLSPGTPVLIDVIKNDWAHLSQANTFHDLGFVPTKLLRKVA